MRDYLKCVAANRATLTGYLGTAAGAAAVAFGLSEDVAGTREAFVTLGFYGGFVCFFLNALTSFGLETLSSYQRTREHISKTGTLDDRFYRLYRSTYCTSKGAQLAAQEAGLEHLIEK